jgi:hypothetical protein
MHPFCLHSTLLARLQESRRRGRSGDADIWMDVQGKEGGFLGSKWLFASVQPTPLFLHLLEIVKMNPS